LLLTFCRDDEEEGDDPEKAKLQKALQGKQLALLPLLNDINLKF